jgi:Ribonuclease G/E
MGLLDKQKEKLRENAKKRIASDKIPINVGNCICGGFLELKTATSSYGNNAKTLYFQCKMCGNVYSK